METNNKYNTKVTDEDLTNGIMDEYGCIYSPDGKRLIQCLNDIESYTIKEGTEIICDRTFFYCSSLKSMVIPDSVTKIGGGAFEYCESLQSIVIPNSVTEIGDRTFRNCKSLKSIVISKLVTKIGYGAFWGCENLQSIVIPNSITEIGDCAFLGCTSLHRIFIPQGKREYFEGLLGREYHSILDEIESTTMVKYSKDGKCLLKVCNIPFYTIKEGTEVICNYAFSSFHPCKA